MAEVKGSVLVGVVQRARKEPGVRERLSEADRAFVDSKRVLSSDWYPLDLCERLVLAIEETVTGSRSSTLPRGFGELMAEVQLTQTYRALLRRSPEEQLERLPELWSFLYRDGSWHVEKQGEGRARIEYRQSACRTDGICRAIEGFLERMLALAGSESAEARQESCRHQGDPVCAYRVRW